MASPGVPADPMLPRDDGRSVVCQPLACITVSGSDALAARRFYQGALGLAATAVQIEAHAAAGLRAHWGVPDSEPLQMLLFSRPGIAEAILLRVLIVPATAASARPGLDCRYDGALGFGFPIHGLHRRHAIVEAMGFTATAGVTTMPFPRADGSTYDIGETHWVAPDDVMVLGVDRAHLQPVGPIDPALDIGGPSYSSALVSDAAQAAEFFGDVLGLEMRREFTFESEGPSGGMRLPGGTRVHFQQWFAPGARTGYLVVMQLKENGLRAPHGLGLQNRGIGLWSFPTAKLDEVRERALRCGTRILREPAVIDSPGFGRVRSMILATPDGFPIEVFQC